jgi:two-component system, NtrC family, response regulator GlrR
MDPPRTFNDDLVTEAQPPSARYADAAFRHRVRVRWDDKAGAHEVEIDGRTAIGSAAAAGIVVEDPAVSRIHAELELTQEGLWVRDLGSRNGTFIEGIQVGLARVPDGGSVRVGSTLLTARRSKEAHPVELWPEDRFGPLRGRSTAMREVFARLAKMAKSDATVLVRGETGTGKELVALAIHEASARSKGPFVVVDCAALPDNLIESELFGHARGAFTGADAAHAGAIEAADHGTVFLDEIAEIPLSLQPKLLRVLESRTIRRLGETQQRKVDLRFISATHRDLRRMVNEGTFREDLYFRLAVLPLMVPPLRDRREDIPLLMASFAPASTELEPAVLDEATRRPWRGNVRELRNFVERVVALGSDEALDTHMDGRTGQHAGANKSLEGLWAALDLPIRETRAVWMDEMERAYVTRLLEQHGGNVTRAAEAAGIARTHLHRLVRKYGRSGER